MRHREWAGPRGVVHGAHGAAQAVLRADTTAGRHTGGAAFQNAGPAVSGSTRRTVSRPAFFQPALFQSALFRSALSRRAGGATFGDAEPRLGSAGARGTQQEVLQPGRLGHG